jgi:hypothetical protein
MLNKAKDLNKAKEVVDAVSSSISALDSYSSLVDEKLKKENEQKKAKPNTDESKSV